MSSSEGKSRVAARGGPGDEPPGAELRREATFDGRMRAAHAGTGRSSRARTIRSQSASRGAFAKVCSGRQRHRQSPATGCATRPSPVGLKTSGSLRRTTCGQSSARRSPTVVPACLSSPTPPGRQIASAASALPGWCRMRPTNRLARRARPRPRFRGSVALASGTKPKKIYASHAGTGRSKPA